MTIAKDLAGRSALVTGGGAGIGRAISAELAALGANVIVCGRRRALVDETVRDLRSKGGRAVALVADITHASFTTELDALAPELDVIVHNATAFPSYGDLERIPVAEIERVHEVDVLAPIRITAHVLPRMRAKRFGRILFIGSIAATMGAARQAPYSSAKSALHGFVRSLALETAAHGITCNLIEPGLVLTERVLLEVPAEKRASLIARTPIGRPGTPEEIAAVVAFLASSRASYVTGAIVPVTGGLGLGLS